MNTEVSILSPEKTILTYRLASLGSRIGAHLIDLILVAALIMGESTILSTIAVLTHWMTVQILTLVLSSLTIFLYFILLEGLWNGQTLGKKASGIRVRMKDGTPITFQASLGRNLLRPADMLPNAYFVGIVAIFTTPYAQRLGDLVAGTVVVHEKRGDPDFVAAPHHAGVHPIEEHVGDLRGMTSEEYLALRRFCDRYPQLPTEVQTRMMKELWLPIARRRGIPSPPNIHPLYLAEATVMKYGRQHGLL